MEIVLRPKAKMAAALNDPYYSETTTSQNNFYFFFHRIFIQLQRDIHKHVHHLHAYSIPSHRRSSSCPDRLPHWATSMLSVSNLISIPVYDMLVKIMYLFINCRTATDVAIKVVFRFNEVATCYAKRSLIELPGGKL